MRTHRVPEKIETVEMCEFFLVVVNKECGVSVPEMSEGHGHENEGHRTATSSEHTEEREKEEHKGI